MTRIHPINAFATALLLAMGMTACSASIDDDKSDIDRDADTGGTPTDTIPTDGDADTDTDTDTDTDDEDTGLASLPLSLSQLRTGDFEGTLHCAGPLHRPEEYDDYVAAFPETPPITYVFYYTLVASRRTPAENQAAIAAHLDTYSGIPFLGMSYTSTNLDGTSTGHDDEVAAGLFDDDIRGVARVMAEDGRPFFFRPGFEFNGAWNNYTPETYVLAFQRIHDLFEEEGADQAIFVWNYHPAGAVAPYMDFYPGDSVVDWWGVNLFGGAFLSDQAAHTAGFLAQAEIHEKPVMIPESAPTKYFDMESTATWTEWFEPYFDLIGTGVQAFCYSNRDYTQVPAWADWGDLRIEESETLKPLWIEEISKPEYIHAD